MAINLVDLIKRTDTRVVGGGVQAMAGIATQVRALL